LPTGAWHHIVVTYNTSLLSLYVNGQLNASVAHTTNAATVADNLFIGRRTDNFFFNGSIDEVLIFNRSLSANEVGVLFNASANQYSNIIPLLAMLLTLPVIRIRLN